MTRSFCFWPDFVPEPGVLDATVAAHFADFLDAHVEAGLTTIPTVLVGHMSGENWDPAWRGGRDLYRDVTLVAEEAWLAAELARRFGRAPRRRRLARLERDAALRRRRRRARRSPPGRGSSSRRCARAARRSPSRSATAPGARRSTGADNGFSLRALAPLVDFVGPHVYPMQDDPVRRALAAAFACELAGGFGRPVVLEEFGASSDFGSDEDIAGYYRQVLHTTLLAGARGWLAWCNATTTTSPPRIPTATTPSSSTSGSPTGTARPKPQLAGAGRVRRARARARARGLGAGRRRRGARRPRAPRGRRPLHDRRPTGATFATTSSRATSRPARPTSRSPSSASATGSRRGARLYLVPVREAPDRAGAAAARRARAGGRDRLRLVVRRQHREPARLLAPLGGRAVRRPPPAALRPRRPDRRRRADARARRAPRRARGGRRGSTFRVPADAGARAHLPVEPAGAEVLAVDGARPARAPAPRRRRGRPRPLHLPPRAHGRPHAARQPGGHVAALLRARGRRRASIRPVSRRGSPGPRRPAPHAAAASARSSSTARSSTIGAEPMLAAGEVPASRLIGPRASP